MIFDFETVDPHLTTHGPGYINGNYKIVCCGFNKNGKTYLKDTISEIKAELHGASILVAHNIMYDAGYAIKLGVDLRDKLLIDTKHLAIFNNNVEDGFAPYSLNNLSKKYLNSTKSTDDMGRFVIQNKLYTEQNKKRDLNTNAVNLKKANKWAYQHMDLMYDLAPSLIGNYCLQDVDLTKQLYDLWIKHMPVHWLFTLSNVTKWCLYRSMYGIKLNIEELLVLRQELLDKELECYIEMQKILNINQPLLINSRIEMVKYMDMLRIEYPRTDKGNPKLGSDWLEHHDHPFCHKLKDFRHYQKLRSSFCDNILEQQKILPPNMKGRVYPTFYPLGSGGYSDENCKTGRMSCVSPNLQNVPNLEKDKHYGYRIRALFVPDEGCRWLCNDYNQQEFRIFAHGLAANLNDVSLAQKYIDDPLADLHTEVGKDMGVDRKLGKAFNFGCVYGKGVKKQAADLKISLEAAKKSLKLYHKKFPGARKFMDLLGNTCKRFGHITFLDRPLKVDPPRYIDNKYCEFYYKALNYYCQGGGASIQLKFIDWIWKSGNGINLLFSVYDEDNFNIPIGDDEELNIVVLVNKMENIVPLKVPMKVDSGLGNNWAEAKSK